MRVLLTGATGFFAGNLLRVLRARGVTVRYLARGNTIAVAANGLDGVERAPGDVNDAAAMDAACRDVDWVVHAAAIASMAEKDRKDMERVNVGGTERVLAAARAQNVKRFIHISTVDTIGLDPAGVPATEQTTYNFDVMKNPYPDTKKASEDLVLAASREGLDAVIVNPGFMVGAYDPKPSSSRMVLEIMKGKGVLAPSGGNTFTDVLDACEGTLLAAERGKCGERYILAGHNLTYRDFFTRTARIVGRRPPLGLVPKAVAMAFAGAAETVARITGGNAVVNRGEVSFSDMPHYFSSQKAERELGYRISPIEPAIARAADWFKQNHYV